MTKREKRCQDCVNCVKKNGKFVCEDLWDRLCNEIAEDECPEEVEVEDIEEAAAKAKKYKIQHGAKAENKKERKAPERKPDVTKEGFIADLSDTLGQLGADNIIITNKSKIIEFTINGEWYKLDLIRQRNKNKKEGK